MSECVVRVFPTQEVVPAAVALRRGVGEESHGPAVTRCVPLKKLRGRRRRSCWESVEATATALLPVGSQGREMKQQLCLGPHILSHLTFEIIQRFLIFFYCEENNKIIKY